MEKRERRRRKFKAAAVEGWIEKIDRHLVRFVKEMATADVKLADYMRLAELRSIAAESGKGEVIVRWVDCDAKATEEDDL